MRRDGPYRGCNRDTFGPRCCTQQRGFVTREPDGFRRAVMQLNYFNVASKQTAGFTDEHAGFQESICRAGSRAQDLGAIDRPVHAAGKRRIRDYVNCIYLTKCYTLLASSDVSLVENREEDSSLAYSQRFRCGLSFRPRSMHRARSVVFTTAVLGICCLAHAIEPGAYRCSVDKAVHVSAAGAQMAVAELPAPFDLQSFNSPVTPDELRQPLRTTEVYVSEHTSRVSIRIDADLFRNAPISLRSQDGRTYSDGANVIVFTNNAEFTAYGLAPPNVVNDVAVYFGKCEKKKA